MYDIHSIDEAVLEALQAEATTVQWSNQDGVMALRPKTGRVTARTSVDLLAGQHTPGKIVTRVLDGISPISGTGYRVGVKIADPG